MIKISTGEFKQTSHNEPLFGFIIEDGIDMVCFFNWENIPETYTAILIQVMDSSCEDYTHRVGDFLDEVYYNELSININDTDYSWEELKPTFEQFWIEYRSF